MSTTFSKEEKAAMRAAAAYANAAGNVVVFFQSAAKFKVRYATIGFQPDAQLDEGDFWPTSYAVTKLSAADQERLLALLAQAAG